MISQVYPGGCEEAVSEFLETNIDIIGGAKYCFDIIGGAKYCFDIIGGAKFSIGMQNLCSIE